MIISTPIYLNRSSAKKSSEETTIKTALKELRNETKELKDAQLKNMTIQIWALLQDATDGNNGT